MFWVSRGNLFAKLVNWLPNIQKIHCKGSQQIGAPKRKLKSSLKYLTCFVSNICKVILIDWIENPTTSRIIIFSVYHWHLLISYIFSAIFVPFCFHILIRQFFIDIYHKICFYRFHFFIDDVSSFHNRIFSNHKQELMIINIQWNNMSWEPQKTFAVYTGHAIILSKFI